MTEQEWIARRAFLKFQSAFWALRDDVQFIVPLEMFKDYQQLDAACRQFFDAANDKMFSKPASRILANSTARKP